MTKKTIIYCAASLVLVALCGIRFDVYTAENARTLIMGLSNSFFVPGIFMLCLSLLSWMASIGAYDSFGFAMKFIKDRFKKELNPETYYDYKQRKAEERSPWFKTMLFFGIALTVIAVILYILWSIL